MAKRKLVPKAVEPETITVDQIRVKLDAPAFKVNGLHGYPESDTPPLTPLERLMMAERRAAQERDDADPTRREPEWTGFRMRAGDDRRRSVGLPGWPGDLNADLTPVYVLIRQLEIDP